MIRINSIRNLAVAIALAGLSLVGGAGCAAQTDHDDLTGNEPARKAHFVASQGSDDDSTAFVGASLDNRAPAVHPNSGDNLGPRPEPWMSEGEANGPRPEPWQNHGEPDDSSGSPSTPPPSGGSSSGSGGTSSSSGGNPGNPNPTSR